MLGPQANLQALINTKMLVEVKDRSRTSRQALGCLKMVSFSGIDGAGKSTQIDALTKYLDQAGIRYSLYRFWDDIAALGPVRENMSRRVFKGDQGVGSPDKPVARRDKNVTAWYATFVRFLLYGFDAIALHRFLRRIDPAKTFIIFDRYLYDELANLPLESKIARLYIRTILRWIPSPDLALLLDADPESATKRKPEYPLDFVQRNRAAYIALSRIAGMLVIPPAAIDETAQLVRELVHPEGLEPRTLSVGQFS